MAVFTPSVSKKLRQSAVVNVFQPFFILIHIFYFLLLLGGFESEKLKVEADGMWQAVFVTFLVYAMMPLKTWVALAFSTVVAATHISVSALLTTNQKVGLHWQQVRLILMCLDVSIYVIIWSVGRVKGL